MAYHEDCHQILHCEGRPTRAHVTDTGAHVTDTGAHVTDTGARD